jgi:hypothetical protein
VRGVGRGWGAAVRQGTMGGVWCGVVWWGVVRLRTPSHLGTGALPRLSPHTHHNLHAAQAQLKTHIIDDNMLAEVSARRATILPAPAHSMSPGWRRVL